MRIMEELEVQSTERFRLRTLARSMAWIVETTDQTVGVPIAQPLGIHHRHKAPPTHPKMPELTDKTLS